MYIAWSLGQGGSYEDFHDSTGDSGNARSGNLRTLPRYVVFQIEYWREREDLELGVFLCLICPHLYAISALFVQVFVQKVFLANLL